MGEHSKIEWTDATWNPITGCSMVSAGCTNCYAMGLAATRLRHHQSRVGLTRETGGRPVWTGEVRINEQWLDQPLRWKRPRRIFVCAHGDLFHEAVPDEWIDRVFAVMALCPQHTFQVLTKRPERALAYLGGMIGDEDRCRSIIEASRKVGALIGDMPYLRDRLVQLPLPNVWLGTSIEDQDTADARIPHLLATPAAVRFVSAEPLLGKVTMLVTDARGHDISALRGIGCDPTGEGSDEYYRTGKLDLVIVGGESGPRARPMHPDWVRNLRDQCVAAGVAFFFKQWGEWAPGGAFGMISDQPVTRRNGDVVDWMDRYVVTKEWGQRLLGHTFTGHGTDLVYRIGKRAAGRLLDGREWNEMPGARDD